MRIKVSHAFFHLDQIINDNKIKSVDILGDYDEDTNVINQLQFFFFDFIHHIYFFYALI
jgi:hypothetical protein